MSIWWSFDDHLQDARHTVESPPPIGENARCFIPCVRIKHRAGCPRHSWVTAPYRGEEIQISLHWNITFGTDRNLSSFSHICVRMEHRATCPSVRIKHRAGCPRHSWVTAPYRGEEIQIWFHENITFETDRNNSSLPCFCVRIEHRARCP